MVLSINGISINGISITVILITGISSTGISITSKSNNGILITDKSITDISIISISNNGMSITFISISGISITGISEYINHWYNIKSQYRVLNFFLWNFDIRRPLLLQLTRITVTVIYNNSYFCSYISYFILTFV